jgi:hypothetical protein
LGDLAPQGAEPDALWDQRPTSAQTGLDHRLFFLIHDVECIMVLLKSRKFL